MRALTEDEATRLMMLKSGEIPCTIRNIELLTGLSQSKVRAFIKERQIKGYYTSEGSTQPLYYVSDLTKALIKK